MDQIRFKYLFDQYILGEISPEGREELARLAGEEAYEALLDSILLESLRAQPPGGRQPDEAVKRQLAERLPDRDFWPVEKQPRRLFPRWVAAAAVLAVVVGASLLVINRSVTKSGLSEHAAVIAPAGNKAVLTLENGDQIVLEQTANGAIAQQGSIRIVKSGNGRLVYENQHASPVDPAAAVAMNKLSTPRGGQIQLVLPDGTAVWLNSASVLKYPAVFQGAERVVELTGEAYFEVAANAHQPFKVKLNGVMVDVLGTNFNIHAYSDEPVITTTLVEGRVRVTDQLAGKEKERILNPGEQAAASADALLTQRADLEQVLSWKNGLFIFEDRKLPDILREMSRWYDIDIEFRAPITGERYGGIINRNSTLPKVLEFLQQNGIRHFKLEGRKLIVLP